MQLKKTGQVGAVTLNVGVQPAAEKVAPAVSPYSSTYVKEGEGLKKLTAGGSALGSVSRFATYDPRGLKICSQVVGLGERAREAIRPAIVNTLEGMILES
jgi:hypothetical protein